MFYMTFFIALIAGAFWCAWRISVTDMRRRIIPDAYLFPLILIALLILAFYSEIWPVSMGQAAIAATFGYTMAATVGFIFDFYRRKRDPNADTPIGFGDIKLLGVGGLWLGTNGLAWALILACISAMVWARIHRTRFIPFAPFFVGGAILAFIGNAILL